MSENDTRTASRSNLVIVLIIVVIAILGVGVYHVRHTKAFVDATSHQPERFVLVTLR